MNKPLAVKYRPTTFEELTEQKTIQDILNYQVSTRTFQHAYLFTGPAGTGKTTSARIFANMINQNKGNPIEIDAASNSGVDNIRNIIEDAKRKPVTSEFKIYIIDECHSLSSGAWQAMLKLLEESPKYSIFILCTTDPQKIPATIMSRVQRYQFNKISTSGIKERLEYILASEGEDNEYEWDDSAVSYLARISNGGMRDAITSMDKCLSLSKNLTVENVLNALGVESYDVFFRLLHSLVCKNTESIKIVEDVFAQGKDLKQFFKQFARFIVDVEKYIVFNDINSTQIPSTYVSELDNLCEIENDINIVLKLVVEMLSDMRWETDMLTFIQIHFFNFIK